MVDAEKQGIAWFLKSTCLRDPCIFAPATPGKLLPQELLKQQGVKARLLITLNRLFGKHV